MTDQQDTPNEDQFDFGFPASPPEPKADSAENEFCICCFVRGIAEEVVRERMNEFTVEMIDQIQQMAAAIKPHEKQGIVRRLFAGSMTTV